MIPIILAFLLIRSILVRDEVSLITLFRSGINIIAPIYNTFAIFLFLFASYRKIEHHFLNNILHNRKDLYLLLTDPLRTITKYIKDKYERIQQRQQKNSGGIVTQKYDVPIETKTHYDDTSESPPSTIVDKTTPINPHTGKPLNLTGSYRLVKNSNFQPFLAANGVPWALRAAADKAVTTQHITHTGSTLRIEVTGIIRSGTTYIINGPAVETNTRDRVFFDSVTYLDSGEGVQVMKVCKTEKYSVVVRRVLSPDGMTLTITSSALFKDKSVEAVQTYQRI